MVEESYKALQNTTSVEIFIKDVGIAIAPDVPYDIPPQDAILWASSLDVVPHLIDGSLVASDEVGVVDGYLGIALLRDGIARQIAFNNENNIFDASNVQDGILEAKYIEVKDGAAVVTDAYSLDFGDNLIVTDNLDGTVTIDATIEGDNTSYIGSIYEQAFTRNGNAGNKWLSRYEDSSYSNESPAVILWESKLIGLEFSNSRKNADCTLQIHVASEGDGVSPLTKIYEWAHVDTRVARKTDISPDVIFSSGDKIGVFLQDDGTNVQDVVFKMYFQIIASVEEESKENFSGYFS